VSPAPSSSNRVSSSPPSIERRERDEERFEDDELRDRFEPLFERLLPLREPERPLDDEPLERPRELRDRLPPCPLLDERRLPPLRRDREPLELRPPPLELRPDRLLDERPPDWERPPDLLLPPMRCAMSSLLLVGLESAVHSCDVAPTRLRPPYMCKRCATPIVS
jgi:hypothetical protein